MSDFDVDQEKDEIVQHLIKARDVAAVLKTKLATLRSHDPDVAIVAFEGIEDKQVYFHWIKRIDKDLVYESFICKGKKKVLQLRRVLARDMSGLGDNVFFVVDRDFDDLQGDTPSDNIFMTDRYSFENYLVDEGVLDEVLKNELHCHCEPVCRRTVVELFDRLYDDFLKITRDINFRIYLARSCGIERVESLPEKIGPIADVSLKFVGPGKDSISDAVVLEREPTEEEIRRLEPKFNDLEPKMRYRGKFALLFFKRWLDFLIKDRNSEKSCFFPDLDRDGIVAKGPVSLDSLAARSCLPHGFEKFVINIKNGATIQ